MNFKITIIAFLWVCSFQVKAQSKDHKWALSLGSASVLYSAENAADLINVSSLKGGSRYIPLFPRISVARYVFRNIIFAGSFSTSVNNAQKYTTFDGELRYDFGTSENRISPYILIGGSLIEAKVLLPTVNFGAGGTFWISGRFGLYAQLTYRYNEERFNSQRSHLFGSAGFVFRFSLSGDGKSSIGDSSRKRVWEKKH